MEYINSFDKQHDQKSECTIANSFYCLSGEFSDHCRICIIQIPSCRFYKHAHFQDMIYLVIGKVMDVVCYTGGQSWDKVIQCPG